MSTFSSLTISSSARILTASQKEFNRLIQKIEKLRREIRQTEEGLPVFKQRVHGELQPLAQTHSELLAELVRLFDRHSASGNFKPGEMKKLSFLINEYAFELIQEGYEELKPIYERHNDHSFEEADAEAEEETAEMMKSMVSAMFGIEFDPDADVSTPQKMQAYIALKMAEKEEEEAERQRLKAERQRKKPKSEKQIEAERKRAEKQQKKEEEQKKITKSVREVYMDLVKTLHPDLELDEEEKKRKTGILQRVTAAFEDNDLLTLLKLQLELERIDQDHLESLAEDRLKLFNKVLRNQVQELESRQDEMMMEMAMMANKMPGSIVSLDFLNWKLTQDIKEAQKAIKKIKQDLNNLSDTTRMRAWLNKMRIS